MKNLKKAERTVIALTLLCLFFTAGYFVGRGTSVKVIAFEQLAPASAITPVISGTESPAGRPEAPDPMPVSPALASDVATPSGMPQFDTEKININTASQAKLEDLPGIGPVLARSIIDYREKFGGFGSIEQIMDVDGIGEKKYDAMKEIITVGKG